MALKGLKMTFSKKNGKMYQDFVMRSTPKMLPGQYMQERKNVKSNNSFKYSGGMNQWKW